MPSLCARWSLGEGEKDISIKNVYSSFFNINTCPPSTTKAIAFPPQIPREHTRVYPWFFHKISRVYGVHPTGTSLILYEIQTPGPTNWQHCLKPLDTFTVDNLPAVGCLRAICFFFAAFETVIRKNVKTVARIVFKAYNTVRGRTVPRGRSFSV